jgi:spermidine synthase
MALQLTLIYTFEALYGHIYIKLGLLIAIFMGGLSLGSYLTNTKYRKIGLKPILLLLLIANIFFMQFLAASSGLSYISSQYLILLFCFAFASITGAIFPVAARNYEDKTLENKAGVLYGADLFGGSIAALFTSLLFIPAYGIIGTCILVEAVVLVSLIYSYRSS